MHKRGSEASVGLRLKKSWCGSNVTHIIKLWTRSVQLSVSCFVTHAQSSHLDNGVHSLRCLFVPENDWKVFPVVVNAPVMFADSHDCDHPLRC